MSLKAIALSIKPGAEVGSISVGGQVRTAGDNVITVEIDGDVGQITIAGGVITNGNNSDAIHTRDDVPASTTCRSTPPTERTSSEPPDPDFAGPS